MSGQFSWSAVWKKDLISYLAGLGLGLYVARLVAELTRVAWTLPAVIVWAIFAALAGLVLARWVTGRIKPVLPLYLALPLWVYVPWPRQDPAVAWGVGLTTLLAWGIQSGRFVGRDDNRKPGLETLIFVTALALYGLTLAPGLQPADGGEFQWVAARFGVAHPPGYPLYTILGGLFAHLPVGPNPAWRLNLFSAVTAAATLALISRVARRVTGSATAGLLAALTLGSATTFWATATVASIRPLTAFFTALILYALTTPRFASRISRPTMFAISIGLGVVHHASLVFVGALGLMYLLLVEPSLLRRPRRWLTPMIALALTQLLWLYLPLRDAAGVPLAPGSLTTLRGLADHILARGFAGDMFAFATPQHLPDRLSLLPTLLRFQFYPLLLVAALVGALALLWRDRRLCALLVSGFAVHTLVTLTYRAPQTVEYGMPAYVLLAVLVAASLKVFGLAGGSERGGRQWVVGGRSLGVAVTLVAGLLSLAAGWPNFRELARWDDARAYARSLLEAAPAGSVILSNWHWATPLWYLQGVEGLRPDVAVDYVAPQGKDLAQNWVDAIVAYADERPVVVVRYFEPQYRALPFQFEPLGPAFVVRTEARVKRPSDLIPLDADLGGQVRLLGYALEAGRELPLDQPATLTLAWTPLQPLEGELALFAHLWRAGSLVGQGSDRRHAAQSYLPGQIILDRFLVYALAGEMPGEVQLTVGAYRPDLAGAPRLTTPDGDDRVDLDTLRLGAIEMPPVTRRPRHRPTVGGPTLTGIDWDTTVPGRWRLYLHWQGRSGPTELSTAVRREGEVLVQERIHLPGPGHVTSVYDLPAEGGPLTLVTEGQTLGPWGVARETLDLPAPRPGERYVSIGGEMVLLDAAVDRETTLSPGAGLRYDLRLVATRPLLRDRIVSVSLVGVHADGSWIWRDASDGVPALGAIPTFKWISGSTVLDRHRLVVPQDAPPGSAFTWLSVYDHFTQAVLPTLDARLLRHGLSIPLDLWTVEAAPGP